VTEEERWEYAGFSDRLFGDLADGIIALLLVVPVYFAIDRWVLGRSVGFLDEEGPFGAVDAFLWLWFLWNLTYLVGRTGQSWGRKVAGVKVVDAEGEPIGFWRALGRNVFAGLVSAPLLYLGFLWVIWDSQKQAWHDKVFRTFVVRRVA
jgi:uncharacterized RDD family membrane protein YckC